MMPFQAMRLRQADDGEGAWVPVSSVLLAGTYPNWGGYTIRSLLDASQMVSGSKLRITVDNTGEPIVMDKCFIQTQAASGDVYDFSDTPVQVTFGGSPTITSAGGVFVSDEISLPQGGDLGLVVAAYFSSTTNLRSVGGAPGRGTAWKSGDDAATVDATGYTVEDGTGFAALLSLIEVFQP